MRPPIPTAQSDHLTLPGVVCWCGNARLVSVIPGEDADEHDLIGRLTRGRPDVGFCSVGHSRVVVAGLRSEAR